MKPHMVIRANKRQARYACLFLGCCVGVLVVKRRQPYVWVLCIHIHQQHLLTLKMQGKKVGNMFFYFGCPLLRKTMASVDRKVAHRMGKVML